MSRFHTLALIAVAFLVSPAPAPAVVQMYLDEIDDVRILNAATANPRVKAARQALQQVEDELMLLTRPDLESLLGKRAAKPGKKYALPVAEERTIVLPGIRDAADHRADADFIDFYPVGDFAAVEAFYSRQQPNEKPIALRFYLKVNETFPTLAPDNLDQRLAWEQVQFGKFAGHIARVLDERGARAKGTGLVKLVERLATRREPSLFANSEIHPVGIGDWSKPVNGLSGRLVIAVGRRLGESDVRETLVYLELQNVTDAAGEPMNVHFENQLRWELRDANGKPVPQSRSAGSGGRPGAMWVPIPRDSAVRLRVNPYGFGAAKSEGFRIPLGETSWLIRAGDEGEYFLSATFTVSADRDHSPANPWSGTLELPAINISSAGVAR